MRRNLNKKCSCCKRILSQDCFYSNRAIKDGRANNCIDCEKERHKKYSLVNKDKIKIRSRTAYLKNKEKINKRSIEWRKNNKEKTLVASRESKRRWLALPENKFKNAIHSAIGHSIANGTKRKQKWEMLVGYSLIDLKKIIESRFLPGMNWTNYGEWQLDHIIPRSVFNFKNPQDIDFKRCWNLNNLRPLWKTENIRKKNKIIKPFQPSLGF